MRAFITPPHPPRDPTDSSHRSISLSLGRLFEKMGAAVGKGAKVSAREFLRLFGNRHRGYDGYRSQQDTFEFWQKLLGELEAEETASGDTTTSIIALMKKLFAIKKLNRVRVVTIYQNKLGYS